MSSDTPVRNFAEIEPWLGRGGQPDAAGLAWLTAQGFATIVNLRLRSEKKAVAGIPDHSAFVHIPIKDNHPPRDDQAIQWLRLCAAASESRRIFVHCSQGEGRTSTLCALVRVAQGSSVEDAIAEEARFGFEPHGKHKRQARFLREFVRARDDGTLSVPTLGKRAETAAF